MDLSKNLNSSLDHAKRMLGNAGTLIIMSVLNLIPVVNLVVIGYAAQAMKDASKKELSKPGEYGSLWFTGLKVVVAGLIYFLIPIAILFAAVLSIGGGFSRLSTPFSGSYSRWGARILAAGRGLAEGREFRSILLIGRQVRGPLAFMIGSPTTLMPLGTRIVLLLLGVLLLFSTLAVATIGIAHMVKTGRFVKAFDIGGILGVIRSIGLGSYSLWILVVLAMGGAIRMISAIPLAGRLISTILLPVFLVFASRSVGLMYDEAILSK